MQTEWIHKELQIITGTIDVFKKEIKALKCGKHNSSLTLENATEHYKKGGSL